MEKIKEVGQCLFYGIMPYWVYERRCHYDCTYWQHLLINLRYAIWRIKN